MSKISQQTVTPKETPKSEFEDFKSFLTQTVDLRQSIQKSFFCYSKFSYLKFLPENRSKQNFETKNEEQQDLIKDDEEDSLGENFCKEIK